MLDFSSKSVLMSFFYIFVSFCLILGLTYQFHTYMEYVYLNLGSCCKNSESNYFQILIYCLHFIVVPDSQPFVPYYSLPIYSEILVIIMLDFFCRPGGKENLPKFNKDFAIFL